MFKFVCSHRNRTNCENNISLTPTGTQICRGYKVHGLIRCKSKIQFDVSLESLRVLFAKYLIHDT